MAGGLLGTGENYRRISEMGEIKEAQQQLSAYEMNKQIQAEGEMQTNKMIGEGVGFTAGLVLSTEQSAEKYMDKQTSSGGGFMSMMGG